MYSRVRVRNFRGIKDLQLTNLARINLIVGPNNAGKTSLLEALWLLHGPGNTFAPVHLAAFRGMSADLQRPDVLWDGLFRGLHVEVPAEIEVKDTHGVDHSLRVSLQKGVAQTIVSDEATKQAMPTGAATTTDTGATTATTLQFQYRVGDRDPTTAKFTVGPGGIQITSGPTAVVPTAIMLPARAGTNAQELAQRFTMLEDNNRVGTFIESLRVLQPDLQGITLGFSVANQPVLRANIGLERPIPLPLFGGGMVRLADILLAVVHAGDGVLMVDEIEEGLYYRSLQSAWEAINRASLVQKTQIFATTHSIECVRAFVAAFAGGNARDQRDMRLYRLERGKDRDAIRAIAYDYSTARTAVEMNLEVR